MILAGLSTMRWIKPWGSLRLALQGSQWLHLEARCSFTSLCVRLRKEEQRERASP